MGTVREQAFQRAAGACFGQIHSRLPPEGAKVHPTQAAVSAAGRWREVCVAKQSQAPFQTPGSPPCRCQIRTLPPSVLSSPRTEGQRHLLLHGCLSQCSAHSGRP